MVVDYELAGTSCRRFLMAAPCRACIRSAHFLDGCALSGLHSLRSCGFLRAQTTFVCLGEKPDLFRNNLRGPRNELDSDESRFDRTRNRFALCQNKLLSRKSKSALITVKLAWSLRKVAPSKSKADLS